MKITRLTRYRTPRGHRVRRTLLLDTDRVKEKIKSIPERIEDVNQALERKVDRFVGRMCDIIG